MKYKILGNTSLKVSQCCLGTMTFGEQNSKESHLKLWIMQTRKGKLFDTAEMYPTYPKKETQLIQKEY